MYANPNVKINYMIESFNHTKVKLILIQPVQCILLTIN